MFENIGTLKKITLLVGIGVLTIGLAVGLVKYKPSGGTPLPQAQLEAAKQAGYNQGYTTGYEAAKEENAAIYEKGYAAARQELEQDALIHYGLSGFVVGILLGLGGVAALTRRTLAERYHALRRTYTLKKAFEHIPPRLPSDATATAEQIARTYANILEQFRVAKGYTVAGYIEQWRPQLKALMGKSVRLMDLIQELDAARTNVDPQKLDRNITELHYTARHARADETRNSAVKSLRRAKQTQKDLQQTEQNLDHCKMALIGINDVLESVHLKISNIKVNTQKTELLDELSSDLEREMTALEEALQEFNTEQIASS